MSRTPRRFSSCITKEDLYQKYIIEKKSQRQIGKELGFSQDVISKKLKEFDIESRPFSGATNTKNLIGEKFERLLVISPIHEKGKPFKWLCECDCGKKIKVTPAHLKGYRNGCKTLSCGCLKKEKIGRLGANWKGYEEISGLCFTSIRNNAKNRKLEFNVSMKYLNDLFISQDKKCALSGIDIQFSLNKNILYKRKEYNTASLDRIDPTKGYIEGNVQWVHKNLNFMKLSMTQEEFIETCRKVVEFNDQKAKNTLSE